MDTTSWFGLLASIFATPVAICAYLSGVNWYAFGLAVAAPASMLIARQEIRLRRLRAISDFLTSFRLTGVNETTLSTAPRVADGAPEETAANSAENPSFEYVKSKYISDLTIEADSPDAVRLNTAKNDIERINIYIEIASRPLHNIGFRLHFSALGFVLLSYYGFAAFFAAFGYGGSDDRCLPAGGCGLPVSEAVGAFTFAGAYIAALRMLLRNLAVFDLSAFSFVRQGAEIVASVVIVVLLFNALPTIDIGGTVSKLQSIVPTSRDSQGGKASDPMSRDESPSSQNAQHGPGFLPSASAKQSELAPKAGDLSRQDGSPDASAPVSQISWIWLLLAPALGLLPQSATKFALVKTQTFINWAKTTDDRFVQVTKVISLDSIDGIDFETRFRLEDCGIYDIQNLATYNPIMLFIETPYGIYQCIDWVAQAQLCHIIGIEKFVIFRELNIRTIFDLERAIDSIDSPEAYDAICAAILLAPTDNLRKASGVGGFKFAVVDQGIARMEDTEAYFNWLHGQIASPSQTTAAIEHLMSWISDDLHVRRLRRLWNEIAESLGPSSDFLKDSKRNPANADRVRQAQARAATPPRRA